MTDLYVTFQETATISKKVSVDIDKEKINEHSTIPFPMNRGTDRFIRNFKLDVYDEDGQHLTTIQRRV